MMAKIVLFKSNKNNSKINTINIALHLKSYLIALTNNNTMKLYTVTKEKLILGHIPDSVKVWTFTSEGTAKNFFRSICRQLDYDYWDTVFSTDDYFIIAEAGGIGYDYRIMITFERNGIPV